jgi:hypothetical protein
MTISQTSVFRSDGSLGPALTKAYSISTTDGNLNHFDTFTADPISPQLGTVTRGADGGEYFWVEASADIAATATTGTEVIMTFATHSVATGAGGLYTPPGLAVTTGQQVHVRRGAWNANPA